MYLLSTSISLSFPGGVLCSCVRSGKCAEDILHGFRKGQALDNKRPRLPLGGSRLGHFVISGSGSFARVPPLFL